MDKLSLEDFEAALPKNIDDFDNISKQLMNKNDELWNEIVKMNEDSEKTIKRIEKLLIFLDNIKK